MSFHPSKLAPVGLALLLIGALAITPLAADGASKKKTASTSKVKAKSKKASKKTAKKTSKCDRNYSACVPIASDVDCKPGSGNGPKYFTGVTKVLKKDIYQLDKDKDGLACERN